MLLQHVSAHFTLPYLVSVILKPCSWIPWFSLISLWGLTTLYYYYSVVYLTTGPKPLPKRFLHIVRSKASSFKWEYPLLSLRSSSSFLRLFPRRLVTSISPFIFPSITCFRRQFLRYYGYKNLKLHLNILLVLLSHQSFRATGYTSTYKANTCTHNMCDINMFLNRRAALVWNSLGTFRKIAKNDN